MAKASRGTIAGRKIVLKIFLLLIAALIAGGGCGGSGGGSGGGKTLASVSMSDENLEAFGYVDVTATINWDSEDTTGLTLVLFATPEGSAREEVMSSLLLKNVETGTGIYDLTMEISAYDRDMEAMKTGAYSGVRFELQKSTTAGEFRVLDNVDAGNGSVNYTAAADLPVIVKDTLLLDVKDGPKTEGFDGDAASFTHETGWEALVAGVMHGEPIVVAYTANFDVRMELRSTSRDIAGVEITENGGAKIIGKFGDDPVDTYFLAGPFESGEVGVTLTAMYWGNETPPDIGTVSFTVKPVPVAGAANARGASDRFGAQVVTDETLTLARSRVSGNTARGAGADKMEYRDFASMVWNLWVNYEINPLAADGKSLWDERVEPAYFFARMYKDLGVIVDWSTAIAESPSLENLRVKGDFFNGDRPINFEDSTRNRNQFIRVPVVYREAENKYTELYNSSASVFPYGDRSYVEWWATLPAWMIRDNIFPRPARNYASVSIGDMRDDDYFWQYVMPEFETIAASSGIKSYQYDLFWSRHLGAAQEGIAEPKLTAAEYQAILPTGNVVVDEVDNTVGGSVKETPYTSRPIELYYGRNESSGKRWGEYSDNIEYGKSLGADSKFASVGYKFGYSDGVSFETVVPTTTDASSAATAFDTDVTAKSWTRLSASTPAYILNFDVTPFEASAGFEFNVKSTARHGANAIGNSTVSWDPLASDKTQAYVHVTLKFLTMTMFDKKVDFKFDTEQKGNIDSHEGVNYPLLDRAIEVQVVDPDEAAFTLAGIKIGFGFGLTGEAGVVFSYKFGALKPADVTSTNIQQAPAAFKMSLTPSAAFGGYVSVCATIPLAAPLPSITIGIKGSLTLIRIQLPLVMERRVALAARCIDPGAVDPSTGFAPEKTDGTWYLTMEGTKRYALELVLSGLDGNLAFTTKIGEGKNKETESEIVSWEGLTSPNWTIIESTTFRPVAITLYRNNIQL